MRIAGALAPGLLGAALFGGCGGLGDTCERTCNGHKQCANASSTLRQADCSQACSDLSDIAGASDCSGRIEQYLDCENGLQSQCSDQQCASAFQSMATCVYAYCSGQPGSTKCLVASADFGLPRPPD